MACAGRCISVSEPMRTVVLKDMHGYGPMTPGSPELNVAENSLSTVFTHNTKQMGICLNMIVRNEADNLPRLFASLEGQVDFFVISDTGSTDNTPEIIRRLSSTYGIPGIVTHHAWQDFASNRNLALQDALESRRAGRHSCDRLLILDADEELCVREQCWKASLQPEISYSMLVRGERLSASRVSLLWLDSVHWRWSGQVHNALNVSEETHHFGFIDNVFIRTHPFRGAKSSGYSSGSAKAAHDASIMANELSEVLLTRSTSHRFFQWAHVCFLAGSLQQAAEIFSRLAVDTKHDNGLRYAAAVLAGRCSLTLGLDIMTGSGWFDLARSICPNRREDLYYKALMIAPHDQPLASAMLTQASFFPVPAGNLFYLEHELYEWRIDYQLIIWAFAGGDTSKAIKGAEVLLQSGTVPEPERGFLNAMKARASVRVLNTGNSDQIPDPVRPFDIPHHESPGR